MYRPVIILGNGARRVSRMIEHLLDMEIPIMTTWMACDLIPENHPAFCGRPGVFGQRAANIIQQKATHLYCFGARLDGEQVAYDYDRFAPNAEIFVWDIDLAEKKKFPKRYKCSNDLPLDHAPNWLAWCKALYNRYRPELEGSPNGDYYDPFYIIRKLSECLRDDEVIALGSSGGAPNSFYQAFKVKHGQQIRNCSTIGAMGMDIPYAMGAAFATKKRVICLTGDGGFVMNANALETINAYNLDINFIVYNNGGYGSIRAMQDARFDGRRLGESPRTGLYLPSLVRLAYTYGVEYHQPSAERLGDVINSSKRPKIIEMIIDPEWKQLPRVMASTVNGELRTDDMQDMTPKLPPDELARLMEA